MLGDVPLSAEKSSKSNVSSGWVWAEAASALCNSVDIGPCAPNLTYYHGSVTLCVVPAGGCSLHLHSKVPGRDSPSLMYVEDACSVSDVGPVVVITSLGGVSCVVSDEPCTVPDGDVASPLDELEWAH